MRVFSYQEDSKIDAKMPNVLRDRVGEQQDVVWIYPSEGYIFQSVINHSLGFRWRDHQSKRHHFELERAKAVLPIEPHGSGRFIRQWYAVFKISFNATDILVRLTATF